MSDRATTTGLPPAVRVDPYGFDDPRWIDVPASIDERARPGEPKESAPFWEGLRDGRICFQRCARCRRYTHYPVGGCQWCGGEVAYEQVDGRATVNTFAPCYLEFGPGNAPPYVVAIVNPECEPELQVMTNLVDCRISDLSIGMRVEPVIVHGTEHSLLFYRPSQ